MKKIALLLTFVCALCSAYQCESPGPNDVEKANTCNNPEWLTKIINSIEQNGMKGKVVQYQYDSETVFLVNICNGCADNMTVVYNCAGDVRCEFGGIAGFNTCPDFTDIATDEKTIWSN